MSRHATDRYDWSVVAECPNNGLYVDGMDPDGDGIHLLLEASATEAKPTAREAIPLDECPVCGAELDFIVHEEPAEVLT